MGRIVLVVPFYIGLLQGYMNEIALLRRLDGNDRIIRLIESEVKGGSKGHLMLVS